MQECRFDMLHLNFTRTAAASAMRCKLWQKKSHSVCAMAPKKKGLAGLQRVKHKWINYGLSFHQLPADWSAQEAAQNPEPWLSEHALLHALRRLTIQADQPAC
eukprot:10143172-Karenia_brevis.AAC.1